MEPSGNFCPRTSPARVGQEAIFPGGFEPQPLPALGLDLGCGGRNMLLLYHLFHLPISKVTGLRLGQEASETCMKMVLLFFFLLVHNSAAREEHHARTLVD